MTMVAPGHSGRSVSSYMREMRHYGILGNSSRKKRVYEILKKMELPVHPPTVKVPYQLRMLEKYGVDMTFLSPKASEFVPGFAEQGIDQKAR